MDCKIGQFVISSESASADAAGRYNVVDEGSDDGSSIELLPLVKIKKRSAVAKSKPKTKQEHWLEYRLQDAGGNPLIYVDCELVFADGTRKTARTNEYGVYRLDGLTKPDTYKISFSEATTTVLREKRAITLRKVDANFAPIVEDLNAEYEISGLSTQSVEIEIASDSYPAGPIYQRKLHWTEKRTGTHLFNWDGRANCTSGDLKGGKFISPLYSPYRVRIFVKGGPTTEIKEFSVLYHSIGLSQGPWTADEAEPQKAQDWLQYRLNELGYYAGPVGKDVAGYLRKAIIRYRHNHKNLWQLDPRKYKGSSDDDLLYALANDEARRPLFAHDEDSPALKERGLDLNEYLGASAFSDSGTISHILVEALTYEKGESTKDKDRLERKRLNRPLIPVEAVVYLKGKAGDAKDVPQAVGDVRINWRFVDGVEFTGDQYAATSTEPSRSRSYLQKALALQAGGATHGDNCPQEYGGIRDIDGKNYYAPVLLGEYYAPYIVQKDPTQNVVYSRACIDEKRYPQRMGKAGFYFRPSIIAGDDYRIIAEIDFAGLTNKDVLEKLHGIEPSDLSTRIQRKTGRFQIRRSVKAVTVVRWSPTPADHGWAQSKKEFAQAYLSLDDTQIQQQEIVDLISDAKYVEIVKRRTKHKKQIRTVIDKDGSLKKEVLIKLSQDGIVGVSLPKKGKTEPNKYVKLLKRFCNAGFFNLIQDDLRNELSKNIRKTHPTGVITISYALHKPLDIYGLPKTLRTIKTRTRRNRAVEAYLQQCMAAGKNPNVLLKKGFSATQYSIALADSMVFAAYDDGCKPYSLLAHEIGHLFWLNHAEHAGDKNPKFHDLSDHNCLMSYGKENCQHSHHKPTTFTPHFCGKCNLRLRGWLVTRLPDRS